MKKAISLLLILCFILSAYTAMKESPFLVPAGWPKTQYDFLKNPLTPEKTEQIGRAHV